MFLRRICHPIWRRRRARAHGRSERETSGLRPAREPGTFSLIAAGLENVGWMGHRRRYTRS